MASFGKGEPVSLVPEDCWLFSNCQKFRHSPGGARFWMFGLLFGLWGSGVSFVSDTAEAPVLCSRSSLLKEPQAPCWESVGPEVLDFLVAEFLTWEVSLDQK